MKRIRNERGIALAVAIFALVVVGGLVAGAFFVGMQEQRIGQNTVGFQEAFGTADGATQELVVDWGDKRTVYNTMAIGGTITDSGTATGGYGWYRRVLHRLSDRVYMVRTEGFSRDRASRQHLAALLRLTPVEVTFNSALKTQGLTTIGGNSTISGVDNEPDAWTDCDSLQPTLPGLRHPDTSQVTIQGEAVTMEGDPAILEDTTVSDSTMLTFGDLTFDDLKLMANKFVPSGTWTNIGPMTKDDGSCDIAQMLNWGDPLNPGAACGQYFPFIWAEGPLTLSTGIGQGVLVVNGNLNISGNFEFYGPVIVKGVIRTTGTGNKLNGGVISANAEIDEDETVAKGNATINYSSCALAKALTGSALASNMRERGWANLY